MALFSKLFGRKREKKELIEDKVINENSRGMIETDDKSGKLGYSEWCKEMVKLINERKQMGNEKFLNKANEMRKRLNSDDALYQYGIQMLDKEIDRVSKLKEERKWEETKQDLARLMARDIQMFQEEERREEEERRRKEADRIARMKELEQEALAGEAEMQAEKVGDTPRDGHTTAGIAEQCKSQGIADTKATHAEKGAIDEYARAQNVEQNKNGANRQK